MEKMKTLTTLEEIKAFSDPYRMQIIRCFKELGEPATVKQIADEMGEVPAKVHYHVKKLEKANILELIYTKEIKGIIAKYYNPTAKFFRIENCDYEMPMFKDFLTKTQKLFSNVFDDAKRIFIEQLDSFQSDKSDENLKESENLEDGFITSSYLYLNEKQYIDLQNYIKDLSYENQKKDNKEKEKYFLMTSIIRIEDEKNNRR